MDQRARKHKAALEEWLERILEKLIKEYKAEKIILFGSLVTGQIDESTDIDLVIAGE